MAKFIQVQRRYKTKTKLHGLNPRANYLLVIKRFNNQITCRSNKNRTVSGCLNSLCAALCNSSTYTEPTEVPHATFPIETINYSPQNYCGCRGSTFDLSAKEGLFSNAEGSAAKKCNYIV
jgi:hypothetical protein